MPYYDCTMVFSRDGHFNCIGSKTIKTNIACRSVRLECAPASTVQSYRSVSPPLTRTFGTYRERRRRTRGEVSEKSHAQTSGQVPMY